MKPRGFGGRWTQEKLELLREYISAYTRILRRNPRGQYFKTVYVDAFAGAGSYPLAEAGGSLFPELEERSVRGFLKGSPRIALEVDPSFHRYLFIERDPDLAGAAKRTGGGLERSSSSIPSGCRSGGPWSKPSHALGPSICSSCSLRGSR